MATKGELAHIRKLLDAGARYFKAREAIYRAASLPTKREMARHFHDEADDAKRQRTAYLEALRIFDSIAVPTGASENIDRVADRLSSSGSGKSSELAALIDEVTRVVRHSSTWTARFRNGIPATVGEEDIPALVDALDCGSRLVRARAAKSLGDVGARSPAAIRALIGQLWDVTAEATQALVHIGDPAVEMLQREIESGDGSASNESAGVLVRIGTSRAADALCELLESERTESAAVVLYAVANIEDQVISRNHRSQLERLIRRSLASGNEFTQSLVVRALDQLTG